MRTKKSDNDTRTEESCCYFEQRGPTCSSQRHNDRPKVWRRMTPRKGSPTKSIISKEREPAKTKKPAILHVVTRLLPPVEYLPRFLQYQTFQRRKEEKLLTLFSIGIIDRKIEICTFAHLVLCNNLLLQIPNRDRSSIEGDSRRFSLRFEAVEDERRTRHFLG